MSCIENKGEIKSYRQIHSKKYYEKHRERILQKSMCEICGGRYTYSSFKKHLTSYKHLRGVNENNYKKEYETLKNEFLNLAKKLNNI